MCGRVVSMRLQNQAPLLNSLVHAFTKNAQYSGDNQHAAHLLCDISVLLSLLKKSVLPFTTNRNVDHSAGVPFLVVRLGDDIETSYWSLIIFC